MSSKFKETLDAAREMGFDIPDKDGNTEAELLNAQELLKDLAEKVKADPRVLKDPAILKAMAELRKEDPIEYDLLIEAIKKAGVGLKVATINVLVDKYVSENQKVADKVTEPPNGIKDKALAIAKRGSPYNFLIWQAQRNHLGDIPYQKVLIASVASTSSLTSNGIQPGSTGDKGSGKSDACAATYHLIPNDRRLDGSLSPMSLFYLQEKGRLQAGMVLFSDDVEYEPILPIYKRSTARFQQGITHYTVSSGKNREAMELHIPPRLSWWLTSVESVPNEQANDRQSPISTDSSPVHKKMVSKEIGTRRARKEIRLTEDEGILVARAIIADIYDNGPFKVLIPQADKAEWLKYADFRGQEQFWDLVDALAILRWRQRVIDSDGWLVASDKDLIEAKDILTAHKVANLSDLTPAEVQLVGVLTSEFGNTQKELTEALGIAQNTVSERLKSIMAKSPLITEEVIGGKKTYALNPNMSLGSAYWNGLELIKIDIPTEKAYRSQQISLSSCYRYVIGIPIGIIINNSNRIPTTLSYKKEDVKENKATLENSCISCEKCLGFFLSPSKHYDNYDNGPADSECNYDKSQITTSADYDKSNIDRPTPIRLATIRALSHVDQFKGIDGLNYGPFEIEDVVALPRIHARNLVEVSKMAEYVEEVRT